jgi:hypothetical protein
MSKEKNASSRNRSVGLQPSAFTTAKSVEEAAAKAIAETIGLPPELPRRFLPY